MTDTLPPVPTTPGPIGGVEFIYKPLLLGLIGRAGAGKDTVAAHLATRWAFERAAFADPILAMALALFNEAGVPACWATERALKEKPTTLGPSYRRVAQTLGTEWGRQMMGSDFWLRVAEHKVAEAARHEASLVITDVRFPNEAAWFLEHGGLLVRVTRPHLADVAPHESEAYVDQLPHHAVLDNSGSVLTLQDQVDHLVQQLRH